MWGLTKDVGHFCNKGKNSRTYKLMIKSSDNIGLLYRVTLLPFPPSFRSAKRTF